MASGPSKPAPRVEEGCYTTGVRRRTRSGAAAGASPRGSSRIRDNRQDVCVIADSSVPAHWTSWTTHFIGPYFCTLQALTRTLAQRGKGREQRCLSTRCRPPAALLRPPLCRQPGRRPRLLPSPRLHRSPRPREAFVPCTSTAAPSRTSVPRAPLALLSSARPASHNTAHRMQQLMIYSDSTTRPRASEGANVDLAKQRGLVTDDKDGGHSGSERDPIPLGGNWGEEKFLRGWGQKERGKMGPPETTYS